MSQRIDYYFTSLSPFTYLGHQKLLNMAEETDAEVCFKPVRLGQVFAQSGAKPLPERPVARQKYRLLELERWAKKRELPINLHPAFFPTDPGLADCCTIALQESGHNAGVFVAQVLAACWAEEKNIADETVLSELLSSLNFDAQEVLQQARSAGVQAIYDKNTENANEQGVLGAPAYLLNGEQFWGQDRLELLEDSLKG